MRHYRVAGVLYRAEVKKDLDTLSAANQQAKKTADDADQAATDAKEKFKERVDEIANSDDDIGDILSEYNPKRFPNDVRARRTGDLCRAFAWGHAKSTRSRLDVVENRRTTNGAVRTLPKHVDVDMPGARSAIEAMPARS